MKALKTPQDLLALVREVAPDETPILVIAVPTEAVETLIEPLQLGDEEPSFSERSRRSGYFGGIDVLVTYKTPVAHSCPVADCDHAHGGAA